MSGGSFNYLEFKDIRDHEVYTELKNMIEYLKALPVPPNPPTTLTYGDKYKEGFLGPIKEPNTMALDHMKQVIYHIEEAHRIFSLLAHVIHALEWRASSNWGDDKMYEALENYNVNRGIMNSVTFKGKSN